MRETKFSFALESLAADPENARAHFQSRLSFETDPWDVKTDMERGRTNFIVIDTRSPAEFAAKRIAGAINIPYRSMSAETTAHLPKEKLMVTYCSGPGCNASTKGALKLAALGFRVKELIGGLEYWIREDGQIEETLEHEANRPGKLRGVA